MSDEDLKRPEREDLPGSEPSGSEPLWSGSPEPSAPAPAPAAGETTGGWLPPSDAEPGVDPFGRPWERKETSSEPTGTAPGASWPGATQGPPPSPAAWPGGHATAPGSAAGRPAGFGSRAGAAVIDGLIQAAIIFAPALLGAILFVVSEEAGAAGVIGGLIIGFLASLVYAPYMIARHNGQTVGKKVTNVRVVNEHGGALTTGQAIVREFAVKGLLIGVIGQFTFYVLTLLNYLWPLWDDHNHALHDKLVKTQVIEA